MLDTPLRLLVESVYQPTDARRDAVLAHDWSELPRIARALDALPRPVTNVALSDAAWTLVHEAAEALAAHFPPMPGTVTPLEVVRLHVLERQPWPSLEAQMREEGRPVSRGTLIRRQHEFLGYFAEWARVSAEEPEHAAPVAPVEPARTETSPPRRGSGRRLAVLVTAGVIIAAAVWAGASREPDDRATPRMQLGRHIIGDIRPGDTLPEPWPAIRLPEWDAARFVCMLMQDDDGRTTVFVTYRNVGKGTVSFRSWDPSTETVRWESEFDPPRDERMTHETLEEATRYESYHPARVYYASLTADLGDWAAVYLLQKYSPIFLVFVHIRTGEIGGYYLHPGHFTDGAVFDLDGDARGELVLAGTDNSLNLPVVATLQPGRWTDVASTVMWNEEGTEGAMRRVILPDWEAGRLALAVPRLHARGLLEGNYDVHHDVLSVGVGSDTQALFHVRLDGRLRPRPETPFLHWDADRVLLAQLGLDPPDFTGWEDRVITIEGIDRRAGDESR